MLTIPTLFWIPDEPPVLTDSRPFVCLYDYSVAVEKELRDTKRRGWLVVRQAFLDWSLTPMAE